MVVSKFQALDICPPASSDGGAPAAFTLPANDIPYLLADCSKSSRLAGVNVITVLSGDHSKRPAIGGPSGYCRAMRNACCVEWSIGWLKRTVTAASMGK